MIQINLKQSLIVIAKFDRNFGSLYVADIGKHTSLLRRQKTEVG